MKRSEKAGTILHKQRYQYLGEVPTSQKLLALLTQADEKGVKYHYRIVEITSPDQTAMSENLSQYHIVFRSFLCSMLPMM